MLSLFAQENAIRTGWIAGWLVIIVSCTLFGAGILAAIRQVELPLHYINPVESILHAILYVAIVMGMRGFAVRRADAELTAAVTTYLVTSILLSSLVFLVGLDRVFSSDMIFIFVLAFIPIISIMGIAQMRIAEHMKKYSDELGGVVRRVVWWTRVSGWMMASVILCIPGVLMSFVADFFWWRFLSSQRAAQVSTTSADV